VALHREFPEIAARAPRVPGGRAAARHAYEKLPPLVESARAVETVIWLHDVRRSCR
jgi:hypothetical protein